MKVRSASVDLLDKILNEREWKKPENRIVIEETFEQLYGKPLDFHEIKTLIYADTPNAAFSTYLRFRPILEHNSKKTKFRFRKNKNPYLRVLNSNVPIPVAIIKGFLLYFVFGVAASLMTHWLINGGLAELSILWTVMATVINTLLWMVAVLFLIDGLRYQWCERDIRKHLRDRFEFK